MPIYFEKVPLDEFAFFTGLPAFCAVEELKHQLVVQMSRLVCSLTLVCLFPLFANAEEAAKSASKKSAASVSKSAPAAPQKSSAAPKKRVPVKEDESAREENGAPRIHAASAIVVDLQNGNVLHAINPDQRRPVASTQKLLTALLVAEAGDLDKKVRIELSDTWAEPSKLEIKPGEVYRKGDLLKVLMVKSMNDVARALARDTAGSVEAFAQRMNARAAELGMNDSHFVNPNGLPASEQYSTARDMAKVAAAAYRVKAIREAVKLKELQWESPSGEVSLFQNTNRVLGSLEFCNGMKTGYTVAAGFCLVSSGAYRGRDVIAVVLGDSKPYIWRDSHRLLAWALGVEGATAEARPAVATPGLKR